MRRAKILATIGPASREQATLEKLIKAGLNAVRINMSHGTHEDHEISIKNARTAAKKLGKPLAILVDLSGPKIRTKTLIDGKAVKLNKGETFVITSRDIIGNEKEVSTTFTDLPKLVKKGETILLDDGALKLTVEKVKDTDVVCRIVVGGMLAERKGINLPSTYLPIPSLTPKDRIDLEFAMAQNVDYIALSFVRTAKDCQEVKDLIKSLNTRKMGRSLLVAKIEKIEAINNLEEIIKETDGVMVARGDLGVETSVEKVPVYQKEIIQSAVAHDKFVITATQMLQTMIDNPFPTRAEASDVANAVWDGSDAVMLSAETASGNYPIESVKTMAQIIESAEEIDYKYLKKPIKFEQEPSGRTSQALCRAAAYAAKEVQTKKVAVFTESGLMARRLSSYRSGLQTYALTSSPDARNQLALIWGVEPLFQPAASSSSKMLKAGQATLLEHKAVEKGETLIMMAGRLSGLGLSSSVVVWTIGNYVAKKSSKK
jgi:pyruvate kinase